MNRARTELPVFVLLILGVGAARFALTMAGVADDLTRYASMTLVIGAGIVWFGSLPTGWRERMQISYALILPYMLVETAALGYTWLSGRETIFHAPEYALGWSIGGHLLGHLAGGLTWEPLGVFAIMSALSWVISTARGG
jgi:hypothetical protein